MTAFCDHDPSVIWPIAPLFASLVTLAGGTFDGIPKMRDGIAAMLPCAYVTLRFGGQDGVFAGASQSGIVLVVRNVGSSACRMPGLPAVRFADNAGHDLAVVREPPPGMHPGPAIPAIRLAPGAQATAALHWVSGDVSDGQHCMTPTRVAVGEGPDAPTEIWRFGPLCGPVGKPIVFQQPVLKAGPVAAP